MTKEIKFDVIEIYGDNELLFRIETCLVDYGYLISKFNVICQDEKFKDYEVYVNGQLYDIGD